MDNMNDKNQLNRERVARHEQKKRDAGLVQRKRWAHPDDWPAIDALIAELNNHRQSTIKTG